MCNRINFILNRKKRKKKMFVINNTKKVDTFNGFFKAIEANSLGSCRGKNYELCELNIVCERGFAVLVKMPSLSWRKFKVK